MQHASSPVPPLQSKRKSWENACNAHLHETELSISYILETSRPKSTGTICHKQDHVFCQRYLHLLHRSRFAKAEGEIQGESKGFRLDWIQCAASSNLSECRLVVRWNLRCKHSRPQNGIRWLTAPTTCRYRIKASKWNHGHNKITEKRCACGSTHQAEYLAEMGAGSS